MTALSQARFCPIDFGGFDNRRQLSNMDVMIDSSPSVRLDVWLWRARFFKTRGLSAKMCESGHVRLERFGAVTRVDKAAQAIKPGDRLIFALGARLIDIEVIDAGERRGPAPEAQTLYKFKENLPDAATKPSH